MPSLINTMRVCTEMAVQYSQLHRRPFAAPVPAPALDAMPSLLIQWFVAVNAQSADACCSTTDPDVDVDVKASDARRILRLSRLTRSSPEKITDMYYDGCYFPPPPAESALDAAERLQLDPAGGASASVFSPATQFLGESDLGLAELSQVLGLPLLTKLIILLLMDRSVVLV